MNLEKFKRNEKLYYVYEHILDGKVFYIGKGSKDRAISMERNELWFEKIGNRLAEVEVKIRAYFHIEADAFFFEKEAIKNALLQGCQLVNIAYNEGNSIESKQGIVEMNHNETMSLIRRNVKEGKQTVIFKSNLKKAKTFLSLVKDDKNINCFELPEFNGKIQDGETVAKTKEIYKGEIPKGIDVILFPKSLLVEKLLKFKFNENCTLVIFTDKELNETKKTFALNLFDEKVLKVESKNTFKNNVKIRIPNVFFELKIPDKYLNRNLTKQEKDILARELDLYYEKGGLLKWQGINKLLSEEQSNYEVISEYTYRNGKRMRSSKITEKK